MSTFLCCWRCFFGVNIITYSLWPLSFFFSFLTVIAVLGFRWQCLSVLSFSRLIYLSIYLSIHLQKWTTRLFLSLKSFLNSISRLPVAWIHLLSQVSIFRLLCLAYNSVVVISFVFSYALFYRFSTTLSFVSVSLVGFCACAQVFFSFVSCAIKLENIN